MFKWTLQWWKATEQEGFFKLEQSTKKKVLFGHEQILQNQEETKAFVFRKS